MLRLETDTIISTRNPFRLADTKIIWKPELKARSHVCKYLWCQLYAKVEYRVSVSFKDTNGNQHIEYPLRKDQGVNISMT